MDKSEITKFRKALKNGEVKFSYTKKDGSLRRAVGTLCEKLLPKETSMDTYDITCIEWMRLRQTLTSTSFLSAAESRSLLTLLKMRLSVS